MWCHKIFGSFFDKFKPLRAVVVQTSITNNGY